MAFEDYTGVATAISMTRGDTGTLWNLTFTEANGTTPFNLTGCALWMTAKALPTDLDAAIIFSRSTLNTGITITYATGGLASVSLAAADTSTLTTEKTGASALYYDVQIKDASGTVRTKIKGRLTVFLDITIPTV